MDEWDWDHFKRLFVVMPREDYSPQNIDRLFRYYSQAYPPDKLPGRALEIFLYVPKLENEVSRSKECTKPDPDRPVGVLMSCKYRMLANYKRGNAALMGAGGEDEVYWYHPRLDGKGEEKMVLLQGALSPSAGEILDEWEVANEIFKVEATAYRIPNAEIPEIYYAFTSRNVKTNDMTYDFLKIRLDGKVRIPREQVKFVSEKTGYVYIGWKFSVTVDGGEKWQNSDFRTLFKDNGCYIKKLAIDQSGSGNAELKDCANAAKTLRLSTTNYGQSWTVLPPE